jgi:hypothetical protein
MTTTEEWYVYASVAAGVVVIGLLFTALCCWHRARLRAAQPENQALLGQNQSVNNRESRTQGSNRPTGYQEQLLDADAWYRINTWVIETYRHFVANDMDPIDDVAYADATGTTPSASYTDRGARLVPMPSDEAFPATPRSTAGLSPRVSVGASDMIAPSRNPMDP